MVKTRGKITKVNGRNQKFWNCRRADKEASQEELRNLSGNSSGKMKLNRSFK